MGGCGSWRSIKGKFHAHRSIISTYGFRGRWSPEKQGKSSVRGQKQLHVFPIGVRLYGRYCHRRDLSRRVARAVKHGCIWSVLFISPSPWASNLENLSRENERPVHI